MKSDVKKLALESGFFENPKVSFLAEGYGNYNYLIEEKGEKFVLRIKKSKEKQFATSLEKEFIFLQYFDHKGISFVPKALYFSKKNNFLIQTFLEGEKLSQRNFTNHQIDRFAKQLYELFSLSIKDFYEFCKENNFSFIKKVSDIDSLKIYGFNRFREIKKEKIDKKVVDWININLENNYKKTRKSFEERMFGFVWGDTQSNLIVNNKGKMFFYDFEHTNIRNRSNLSYIKIHGKFNDGQFLHLVKSYAKYSSQKSQDVLEDVNDYEKIIRVNDVIWATMKWAETGEKKFEDLTYKRIELAEKIKVADLKL